MFMHHETVPRYYTVTFMHEDGTILLYLENVIMASITAPDAPEKQVTVITSMSCRMGY